MCIRDRVMEVISNNDLSSLQKKVEDKIEEENITAMELCAGFLKLHLGDDMEEIPAENYIEEMRKKRAERKGGRSGRRDDRRGDDDRREGKGRRSRQTDEDVLDMMREHRPGTVSYTHLDVYKRQHLSRLRLSVEFHLCCMV